MPRKIKPSAISGMTVDRLSIYLRCLTELEKEEKTTISSRDLADRFHLNSAQIRKDLANFGEFGVRGVGYYVSELKSHLTTILGLTLQHRVTIIGAGHLGLALADYPRFHREGFQVVALFDSDKAKAGTRTRGGIPILDVSEFCNLTSRENVSMAIIAVPATAAQKALDLAVEGGVRAVLNFSPARLEVPEGVRLRSVDLTIPLESLSFHLSHTAHPISRKR